MGISFVRWIVVASLISCGGSDLRCPDVAEIGSTDLLTCTYSNASSLSYQSPDGTNVVNCVKELCSDPKNGYALTRIDSNKSNLAIMNVTLEHEGKWVCQADQTRKDCSFVVSGRLHDFITPGIIAAIVIVVVLIIGIAAGVVCWKIIRPRFCKTKVKMVPNEAYESVEISKSGAHLTSRTENQRSASQTDPNAEMSEVL